MTQNKFTTGAFVFTRARGLQPRDPDNLQPLASQHGLPGDIIPTYAGDRAAIGRAVTQTSSGLHREGFLLRPIRRSGAEVVYGIVHEQKDESGRTFDHKKEMASVGPRRPSWNLCFATPLEATSLVPGY